MQNKKYTYILIIMFSVTTLTAFPQLITAKEHENRALDITPIISSGYISEYISSPNFYKGAGFSIDYKYKEFQFKGISNFEEYNITYYGAAEEGLVNLINNRAGIQLMQSQTTLEKKEDYSLLIGKNLYKKKVILLFGWRHINLINSFSSMEHVGPVLGLNYDFNISNTNVDLNLIGSINQQGISTDHNRDFVRFDNEKNISYFGEPKYLTEITSLFMVKKKSWFIFSMGYNWSLHRYKYVNRYKNGIILQLNIH